MRRSCDAIGRVVCIVALLALAGCATPSLDMSGGRIEPAGPDGGVVIGSVLVHATQEPSHSWFNRLFGRKAAGFTYDVDIVKVDRFDPEGTRPYANRYELAVTPGEERIFVARLPVGDYLIKSFLYEGLSVIGGDLGLVFSIAPDETRYIGRLVLDVPRRVTIGTPYTYTVEDSRDAAFAVLHKEHPDLGRHVVIAPMQAR